MTLFQWMNKKSVQSGFANQGQKRTYPNVPDYRASRHYKGHLDGTLEYLAQALGVSDDYMVRITQVSGLSAACTFVSTICDSQVVEDILKTIHDHKFPRRRPKNLAQYLMEKVLTGHEALFMTNLWEIRECITAGDAVLFIDTVSPAIVIGATYVEHRTPEQPLVESSTRGSQISFVEDINTNIGLIRRSLASDTLRIKKCKVGFRSRTNVAVIYMDDVANPVAVETVLQRISAIHVDYISQGAAVEQRIVDNHWTLFPLTRVTQRIDSSCREVNQGKIIIIVDGDPSVMVVPATLQDFFQTEEDYSHSYGEGTFMRWLRFFAFVFAVYLPSLYIAFVDFNPELLPKVLGFQIAQSREGVPFPAVIEVVLMQIVIEILREATLRMPKNMGQTIGIVGGLVVGQASVEAGLVSNILIIVVALTAISVFVTPSYEFTAVIRLASWFMVFMATMFGLYGIVLASILVLYHLASLKSFGVSYLDPFNGEHFKDALIDGLIRIPVWAMDRRTSHLHPKDTTGSADYRNPVLHPQLEKGLGSVPKSWFRGGQRRR